MNDVKVYYYVLIYNDYSIRVYRSFTTIFHKCMNTSINLFSYILALCLMLLTTHYAQNYAGIIGGPLHLGLCVYMKQVLPTVLFINSSSLSIIV